MTLRIGNDYKRSHECAVPLQRFTWAGLTRPVHEGIVGDLVYVRHHWRARGGQDAYEIRVWWGYAPRSCDGDSWHEVGLATDTNPAENPYVSKREPCPSDRPPWLDQLFADRGFGNGANWRSVCDAMHDSKGPNEGGDGVLYVPAGIDPERPERPTGNVHTVRSGETLSSIAARYGTTWRAIYERNQSSIANPDVIQPGLEIVIPGGQADEEPGHTHPTPDTKFRRIGGRITALVWHPERDEWFVQQPGDRWWEVADIQRHLLDAGVPLPRYGADGLAGRETRDAVLELQRRAGVARDAWVGPVTWGHLHG